MFVLKTIYVGYGFLLECIYELKLIYIYIYYRRIIVYTFSFRFIFTLIMIIYLSIGFSTAHYTTISQYNMVIRPCLILHILILVDMQGTAGKCARMDHLNINKLTKSF